MPLRNFLLTVGAMTTQVVAEDYARAVIVIVLVMAFAYVVAVGRPIPSELQNLLLLALGYYFGRGVSNAQIK